MSKAHPPELKKFMDKRVHLRINGGREVRGWNNFEDVHVCDDDDVR